MTKIDMSECVDAESSGDRIRDWRFINAGRKLRFYESTVVRTDGSEYSRDIAVWPDSACIVVWNDQQQILLVRQYRAPAEQDLWEIPAGGIEDEEEPLAAAIRECEEETGYKPGKMKFLFEAFACPGYSTEKMYYYLATDLVSTAQNLDHDERIVAQWVHWEKALQMIQQGLIIDNKSIAGIQGAHMHLHSFPWEVD